MKNKYKEAYEVCKDFIEQCIVEGTVSEGYANDVLEEAESYISDNKEKNTATGIMTHIDSECLESFGCDYE